MVVMMLSAPTESPDNEYVGYCYPIAAISALGRDHTLCSKWLPNKGVISLAVELGISQYQPDARLLGSRFDDCGQVPTVVVRNLRTQK